MANVKISGLPEASAGTVLNTDTIVGVFNGITKKCKLSSINLDVLSDGTNYKRISATKATKINEGTFSEDDLADGTSYKRVQAAKADAINGGTFDAASVLAFGIGGDVKLLANNYDLNTLGGLGTGIYKVYDATNRPTGINNYAYVIQIKFNTSNCYQEFIAGPTSGYSAIKWYRYKESGTWSSWYKVWTSLSDGNGGQPPIGKGKWLNGAASDVNTWTDFITLPNVWAKYLFLAREPGGYYTYFVSAILSVSNGAIAMINYNCANTINLQIRIGSGLTLQVYQNAGNGAVMQYALIPLTA